MSLAPTNCSTCRKRKVKCDRTSPICNNCVKGGRKCHFPGAFDSAHRDLTRITEASARAKWRSRARNEGNVAAESAVLTIRRPGNSWRTYASPDHTSSPSPSSPLSQDLYELAFHRFCYDFLDPPNGAYARKGTFDMIPSLCEQMSSDSPLPLSVKAAALANLAARTHSDKARKASQNAYGIALSRLAIGLPSTMLKAETVLSSYMLWLYEVFSETESNGSALSHHLGSETIMKSVVDNGSSNRRHFTKSGLGSLSMNYAFLRYLGHFQRPSSWLEKLCLSSNGTTARDILVRLCYKSTRACAALKEIEYRIRTDSSPHLIPTAPVNEAQVLDSCLRSWEIDREVQSPRRRIPIHARERRTAWVRDLLDQPGAPQYMMEASRSEDFLDRKLCWIFRLGLNHCILDLSELLQKTHSTFIRQPLNEPRHVPMVSHLSAAVQAISEIAEAMLATVPEVLGIQPPTVATVKTSVTSSHIIGGNVLDEGVESQLQPDPERAQDISGIRGYHMFWPLFNLLKSYNRTSMHGRRCDETKAWIANLLRFLWQEVGIAQAECYRRWFDSGLETGYPTAY